MVTMSNVVTRVTRIPSWRPALLVTVVVTILAGLFSPLGPLGDFWRPPAHMLNVSEGHIPFIIMLGLTEAFCFGLGVAFLVYGYPMLRTVKPLPSNLIRATHFAIAWLLGNWWLHDSLHLHFGMQDVTILMIVDYSFHMTLMLAAVITAYFFMKLMRYAK